MPVQVRCRCGKQYRVAKKARRLRCQACGEELVVSHESTVRRSTNSASPDSLDIDSPQSVVDHFSGGNWLSPQAGRTRSGQAESNRGRGADGRNDDFSSHGIYSLGDVIVRGTALFVFLLVLGNCAYWLLRADLAAGQAPAQPGIFDVFTWGIVPLLVAGPFSLYIAWIGEEPDPYSRRANRIAGLVKCGIGLALVAIGAVLTVVVSVFLAKVAGMTVAFTGLMLGGAVMIAYGGLSVLTGREFTKTGLTKHSSGTDRRRNQSDWDSQVDEGFELDESGFHESKDDDSTDNARHSRSAHRTARNSRRPSSGQFAKLLGLMVVAALVCIITALAQLFWPAAQPNAKQPNANPNAQPAVADRNLRGKRVPQQPPAGPEQPGFPRDFKFPPVPGPGIQGPGIQGPGIQGPGIQGPGDQAPGFAGAGGQDPRPVRLTGTIGGSTAAHSHTESFEKPMIGLAFELGEWEGAPAIGRLKPLFERAAAGDPAKAVVARDGYVVGGLEVDADRVVGALRLIFVRLRGDGTPDGSDTYLGNWIGKPSGRAPRKIDADGKLVMGIVTGTPGMNMGPVINVGLALGGT